MIFNLIGGANAVRLSLRPTAWTPTYGLPGEIYINVGEENLGLNISKYYYQSDQPTNPSIGDIWMTPNTEFAYTPTSILTTQNQYYLAIAEVYQYRSNGWNKCEFSVINEAGAPEENRFYVMKNSMLVGDFTWGKSEMDPGSNWNQMYPADKEYSPASTYPVQISYNNGTWFKAAQWAYYSYCGAQSVSKINLTPYSVMAIEVNNVVRGATISIPGSSISTSWSSAENKYIDISSLKGNYGLQIYIGWDDQEDVTAFQISINNWYFY